MRKKGLNFLEAIQAMKEGKKVRLASFDDGNYWYMDNKHYASGNDLAIFHKGGGTVSPSLTSFESNDWEIFDDEDWNLADLYRHNTEIKIIDVKKCRDLILEDLKSFDDGRRLVRHIVNKRFGALK
jgi:hypothetical protein